MPPGWQQGSEWDSVDGKSDSTDPHSSHCLRLGKVEEEHLEESRKRSGWGEEGREGAEQAWRQLRGCCGD